MTRLRAPVVIALDQSNAYLSKLVVGLRSVLEAEQIPMLLVARDPFELGRPAWLGHALTSQNPRGIIVSTMGTHEAERQLEDALTTRPDLPIVHIGAPAQGCSVQADNSTGMAAVVQHLVTRCGVRRPLVVRGVRHHADSLERERVLREVFAEHAIELDESLFVDGNFHRDDAHQRVSELLRRRRDIDAVIALNDRSALGAMDAVTEAGLRIPQDVVVTGFDDDELSAFSLPPLTTVSQEAEAQGSLAARLLLRLIAGDKIGAVRVPTHVLLRESTGRVGGRASDPIDDPSAPSAPVPSSGGQLWTEVMSLETTLSMTWALMRCTSTAEMMAELAAALPRLNIERCFVVLLRTPRIRSGTAPSDPSVRVPASVALAYGPGLPTDADLGELFDARELLPPTLAHQLRQSTLTMQPLSTEAREFGYLLIQQRNTDRFVGEALRMDVSRSLESVLRIAQLAAQAQGLEALVAERTRELETEVATRRRAEDSLLLLNEELRLRLHVDGLTEICNRVGFDSTLQGHWSEHGRTGSPLSLLMIDTDHFKQFNDSYGHLAGDECLRTVARCLRDATGRPHDLAARYGGDEFAVILPNTTPEGALAVARHVRAAMTAAAIPHEQVPAGVVTLSIGVATAHPSQGKHAASLVAGADAALYAAKRAGRNRTVLAGAEVALR